MKINNRLREALANLVDVIDRCDSGSPLWWHGGAKGVAPLKNAKAALAEPVRNCEVGTAEEQEMRFIDYCSRHHKSDPHCDPCKGCPLYLNPSGCQFSWAQMPYKEGDCDAD